MLIDVGFKNYIAAKSIVSIIKPNTSKAKQLINEATLNNKLIDCTQGKKTSVLILLLTRHLVLSNLKYTSIIRRINSFDDKKENIETEDSKNDE
jgi:regulator of extracellular matrix RemA (YlzA/DUF370 family)